MAERTDIHRIKIASSTLNNHSKHGNGRLLLIALHEKFPC